MSTQQHWYTVVIHPEEYQHLLRLLQQEEAHREKCRQHYHLKKQQQQQAHGQAQGEPSRRERVPRMMVVDVTAAP